MTAAETWITALSKLIDVGIEGGTLEISPTAFARLEEDLGSKTFYSHAGDIILFCKFREFHISARSGN